MQTWGDFVSAVIPGFIAGLFILKGLDYTKKLSALTDQIRALEDRVKQLERTKREL